MGDIQAMGSSRCLHSFPKKAPPRSELRIDELGTRSAASRAPGARIDEARAPHEVRAASQLAPAAHVPDGRQELPHASLAPGMLRYHEVRRDSEHAEPQGHLEHPAHERWAEGRATVHELSLAAWRTANHAGARRCSFF